MNSEQAERDENGLEPAVGDSLRQLIWVFSAVGGIVILLAALFGNGTLALVALISALACFTGAIAGHLLGIYPRGNAYVLPRLYASMFARAGLPLAILFICKVRFEELFSQGMVYFVVLFYLVGMVTDLLYRMRLLKMQRSTNQETSATPTTKN